MRRFRKDDNDVTRPIEYPLTFAREHTPSTECPEAPTHMADAPFPIEEHWELVPLNWQSQYYSDARPQYPSDAPKPNGYRWPGLAEMLARKGRTYVRPAQPRRSLTKRQWMSTR